MKPARAVKFWRDHVFARQHDWELKLDLGAAEHRFPAAENGLKFYAITRSDDELLSWLDRDFPRQSRSFRRDISAGCVMMVIANETQTLGYFFAAMREFYDRAQYRLTFAAGDGVVYSYNFYVDPDYRAQPVARVLLSEGFNWLATHGQTSLYATVRSDEKPLVRLYRQFKILPTGRGFDTYRLLHARRSFRVAQRG